MTRHYQGLGGAPGIAFGRVYRYRPDETAPVPTDDEDAEGALTRFRAAQQSAAEQLYTLEHRLRNEGRTEEADIVDTQALFLEDPAITDEVTRRVREGGEPLEQALAATIAEVRASFEALEDTYWSERAADIDAIGLTLRAALRGAHSPLDNLPPDAIIVAPDLTPAETAVLRSGTVAGFATAYGGPTGHTAILARSLAIPAVVGLGADVLDLADGTELILDGEALLLIAEPDAEQYGHYTQRLAELRQAHAQRQTLHSQPGQLADGQRVALWANIGHPNEARLALEYGAEGVGLFRTEYLFLDRMAPPDEEEQYAAYRQTLEVMDGRPVVIRTLDLGGDKALRFPYLDIPTEANPFLGVRGLRLCMRQPELFQPQLRALLRAASHGDLWVMLPMVATPADLAWGREQLRTAAASLHAEGRAHRADVPLGIMIETPAAAVTVDLLARDAAFLSVGSNDLTQYAMAADRGSAELAAAYPHHAPAVLRLIAQAAAAAVQAAIPIGVCGALAGIPEVAPLLVGMGVHELSMAPPDIPAIKERLLSLTMAEAQEAAHQALQQTQPA
jgi:phosphotransferase system enzyme I (PtsI)